MNITVPTGANSADVQVLDSNGADITGTCTITAESSDPSVVAIGNPDPASPAMIPFNVVGAEGSTADIVYTATNASGNVAQTDVLVVAVTVPTSMVITYGTTIPVATPAAAPAKAKK
jgi:hypothetical protein